MGFARPQIAVNAEAEAPDARAEVKTVKPTAVDREDRKDFFVEQDGLCYAGSHLIIDLWDAHHLDDIEMIEEVGYCSGIENYSRYFDGRKPGEPPWTLLDYFRIASERRRDAGVDASTGPG